jgi:bacterioferritin-associated ferredoxin
VIVCHCKAVNDRIIRAAVLAGADDVTSLGEKCRAGTDCGGCHERLEALIHATTPCEDTAVAVA